MCIPSAWTEDTSAQTACQAHYVEKSVSGYTVAGGCPIVYKSPDGSAYVQVAMTNAPLPVTADRVYGGAPWDDDFPGYEKVSTEVLGSKKLSLEHIFTFDGGYAKQMLIVNVSPPQQWQCTCVAATEADWEQRQDEFDVILESFKLS